MITIYLTTNDLIQLNSKSKKESFKLKLDRFHVKQLDVLGDKVTWIVIKVLPLHVIDNREVDRHFRLFIRPDISCDREGDPFEGMSSDELAAIVCLQSFAIDIAEDSYTEFFGNFDDETEFEDEQQ